MLSDDDRPQRPRGPAPGAHRRRRRRM